MKTIAEIKEIIENRKTRSAWERGVKTYALELIEDLTGWRGDTDEFYGSPADSKELLNGAGSWSEYSWGGSSLIYDCDIAERLCSPSELRKTHNGERRPNAREEWLDVQARALYQAANMILREAKGGNAAA